MCLNVMSVHWNLLAPAWAKVLGLKWKLNWIKVINTVSCTGSVWNAKSFYPAAVSSHAPRTSSSVWWNLFVDSKHCSHKINMKYAVVQIKPRQRAAHFSTMIFHPALEMSNCDFDCATIFFGQPLTPLIFLHVTVTSLGFSEDNVFGYPTRW